MCNTANIDTGLSHVLTVLFKLDFIDLITRYYGLLTLKILFL